MQITERRKDLHPLVHFPKWLQRLELGPAAARSLDLHWSPRVGRDGRGSKRTRSIQHSSWPAYKMPESKQCLNVLSPKQGPGSLLSRNASQSIHNASNRPEQSFILGAAGREWGYSLCTQTQAHYLTAHTVSSALTRICIMKG